MDDNFAGQYRAALERLATPTPFADDGTLPDIGPDGEIERWIRGIKEFAVRDFRLHRGHRG